MFKILIERKGDKMFDDLLGTKKGKIKIKKGKAKKQKMDLKKLFKNHKDNYYFLLNLLKNDEDDKLRKYCEYIISDKENAISIVEGTLEELDKGIEAVEELENI